MTGDEPIIQRKYLCTSSTSRANHSANIMLLSPPKGYHQFWSSHRYRVHRSSTLPFLHNYKCVLCIVQNNYRTSLAKQQNDNTNYCHLLVTLKELLLSWFKARITLKIMGIFFPREMKKIILCEIGFNPPKVKLNQTFQNSENWNFEFLWIFRILQCLVQSDITWV